MTRWSLLAVCVAFAGVLAGCGGAAANNTNAAPRRMAEQKPAPIPVEAQLPVRGPLSEYFNTNSRVEAERSVQVTCEGAGGKCIKLHAEEGDKVSKGDVLAELDTSEINTQIASAKTQLAKTKADYERAKASVKEGLVAPVELENARYAYEQQQASVDQLNVQLSNMTVRSPLSGVVTKKLAQVGQNISGGSPCYEIIDPSSYVLNVNAPEKDYLSRIKVGQKAIVKLDSLDEDIDAKVRKINPAVDETTGTVKVTLDFDKSVLPKLRDNAFARVDVVLATHEDALMVPKEAIVEENARKYVFVVERETPMESGAEPSEAATDATSGGLIAKRNEVKTGLEDSAHVEILEGLTDANVVVTVGQQTLKPDAEVQLTTTQEALLAKASLSASEALKAAEQDKAQQAGGQ